MTSSSNLGPPIATALVPYDPTLPHVSMRSHLEKVTDEVCRRSLRVAKFEGGHLSSLPQAWKEKTVTGIATGLSHLYIDKAMGQKMARVLLRNLESGKYTSTNPFAFKDAVLQTLRTVCADNHLDLVGCKEPIPEYDPDRSLKRLEQEELTMQQKDYLDALNADRPDFSKKVEGYIIPNTEIGYFKINLFPSPDFSETQPIIDKAMKNIVDAKTLIIDLRENTGGAPVTVACVASYFFDQRQLINQVYERASNTLTSFYAEPEKLDHRFGGQKPIYVLISAQTFSGGEELAYDLQSAKRATVIGQTTRGGAHPTRAFVMDDHMFICIPYAKAINPHTGKNWEGIGVLPDYPLPEETDALTFTRALIQKNTLKFGK